MLAAVAAALDGSGPAILPVDPALPPAAVATTLDALGPSELLTVDGTTAVSGGTGVADDIAVVIATSGTTGVPKGVELSASALTGSASASLARIGAQPSERWLCCLPTFHIAGLGVLVRSLLIGTDPVMAASADRLDGCTHVSLVPTQLRRLINAGRRPDGLKTVLLGGSAAAADLLAEARAAGWPVITTYGMSETSGGCVYDGVPLDGVSAAPDQEGRIVISGPVLFSGYRRQPGLTSSVLVGGSFRTADLGSLAPDGRLVIRGRADDVINTGGEKVVPGDVEAVLGTSPKVADVVVIGVPDAEWGEGVTAFVVPADPAQPPDLDHLRSIVRQALSAHAAPRKVFVMPVFPQLPSGKPDRAALRESALYDARQRATGQRELGGQPPDLGAQ
jgi:o-succinylbenzoate---CoA ligase